MVLLVRGLLFLSVATSFLLSAPLEEAGKYHELLLKNGESEALMKRFLGAWLDEQDRELLKTWLEAEAEAGVKGGRVGEARVWARYLEHTGA
ncbi:hypothetical protein AAFN60_07735 [Roseibacillus persicicus]|uniref:hypothetical protein n=1 Tax=Roseibacillus persicicus TaxID=454148 RepID=UPI00398AC371